MDGETALWYSRSRYSTSDFDRTRRQQEVVMALFERLLSLNGIEKAPELYDIYKENVTTNMTWQDIAPLLPLAAQLSDTSRIHHYYIGPAQVTPWTTPGGAQVLLPNYDAINGVLWQALHSE
jgi:anionic cell wall polymer biosynthesis LytR-Cps2A-Psr (LCP) family protein